MANQNFKVKKGLEVGTALTATSDGLNVTGVVTATQFAGDGSALTGVTASGTGVVVQEEGSSVGTAATINFIGSNVTAALSGGIANVTVSGGSGGLSNVVEDTTPQLGGNLDLNSKDITGTGDINITGTVTATTFSGGGALQSRTVVTGSTSSIINNATDNVNLTGFKSYALMKVGLSANAWIRLYTDSTSRTNDASRSLGEDPLPGSGVIAEVVGSSNQLITPFVMGGNMDGSPSTTIYAAITNLSGSTQSITANLTILQLEQ